jgi:hypothetical protein
MSTTTKCRLAGVNETARSSPHLPHILRSALIVLSRRLVRARSSTVFLPAPRSGPTFQFRLTAAGEQSLPSDARELTEWTARRRVAPPTFCAACSRDPAHPPDRATDSRAETSGNNPALRLAKELPRAPLALLPLRTHFTIHGDGTWMARYMSFDQTSVKARRLLSIWAGSISAVSTCWCGKAFTRIAPTSSARRSGISSSPQRRGQTVGHPAAPGSWPASLQSAGPRGRARVWKNDSNPSSGVGCHSARRLGRTGTRDHCIHLRSRRFASQSRSEGGA